MANTFQNTSLVTDLVTERLSNMLVKGGMVKRDLEGDFSTAKYGSTINMRRPVYFASSTGAVIGGSDTSDIEQGTVRVVVDNRHKVVFELDGDERALDITSSRVQDCINAAAEELANVVEQAIADEAETSVWNYIDATSGITLDDIGEAEAFMIAQGVNQMADLYGCVTPNSGRLLSKEVSTNFSFPSVARVTDAMDRAKVGMYNNVSIMRDQVLATHTSGVATGTILVNGNDQDVNYDAVATTYSQNLVLDGATASQTGLFKAGDVINIAGFEAVNRKTRKATGELQDFIVLADADSDGSGNVTVSISPPIIGEAGAAAGYNTIDTNVTDTTAMDGAAITVKTGQSGAVRKENLIFAPEAMQLAMVDLPDVSGEGAKSSTRNYEGVSCRMVQQYDVVNDKTISRFDVLFAVKCVQPYYAFRIGTSK